MRGLSVVFRWTTFGCIACAGLMTAGVAHAVKRVEQGNLVMEDVPEISAELAARLERYLVGRQATFLDWTPEGGMLIATRFGNVEQIHHVDRPMSARRQLTFYEEPISAALYSPHAARKGFVFLKDTGGNENAQLYFYPSGVYPSGAGSFGAGASPTSGEAKLLTDGRSLNGSPVWSNDGTRVAFFSNARNGVSHDIYTVDPESGAAPQLVLAVEGAWYPLDWSPDDRKLLVKNYVSINESYLYVADVATGNKQRVAPIKDDERIGIGDARFSRDGRGVYLVSDRDSEFKQLRYVELPPFPTASSGSKAQKEDSDAEQALSGGIAWDVEAFDLSADGRYLAYVTNEGGASRLRVLDTRNRIDLPAPILPVGKITGVKFDASGSRLALSLETPNAPRDAWVYDIGTGQLTQWTASEAGPLDTAQFVAAEWIRYPSFDRQAGGPREIPAFVHKPRGTGPFPVLIHIHGGPEAQYRPGFEAFTQFLVNELSIAVVAPNVRGSDGYGKTYLALDNGFKREDAVKDIGMLIAWLGQQPEFDRNRILVMGGSYGGYMSLAALVNFSDRLLGGIDVVGISNFITFLNNTSAYRRDLRRAEYGDERDPKMQAFLRRASPLNNSQRITKPLLVVQGLNDPRVPATEAEQMVAAIRGRGGSVAYLLAKDEGHGFKKKQNRDVYLKTVAAFLQQLIQKSPD